MAYLVITSIAFSEFRIVQLASYAFVQISVLITVLTLTDPRLNVSSDTTTPMTNIPTTVVPTTDVPTTDYDAVTDIAIYLQF